VVAVVLAVLGLYLLAAAGHPPATNPNELVRIELAVAMAMWTTVDLEEPARVYGLSEDASQRDGRVLADKAPGLSFAAIPVVWLARALLPVIPGTDLPRYWPLRHLATGLLVALGTALGCCFLAARIPGLQTRGWAPVALIVALSTPLLTYGTVFFGHAPAAILISVAWILLLRPRTDVGPEHDRTAFLGGAAAGFAIATEYPTVLLAAVVFATLIARRPPWRQVTLAISGLLVGVLPVLIYHQAAFGSPWLTGYAFKADPGFQAIHTSGLSGVSLPTLDALRGILVGSSRGLFFFSPVLLLAPVGLWLMHRRSGWRDVAPLTAAIVVYIAFGAGFVDWQAGWCAAARHLVPAIPLLVIPTMVTVDAMARRRSTLLLLTALVTLSAWRTVLSIMVSPFFPPELDHPLSQFVLPSLRDGVAAPNLISSATGISAITVWLAAIGLAIAVLVWGLGRLGRGHLPWIAAVAALTIASQLAWFSWMSPGSDPRSEAIRAQLLAGLGHVEAAARIESALRAAPPPDREGR
jgi:hypothetical protein